MVAIDGVYSMTGELPPLAELNRGRLRPRAVLYVDDAHGTGVIGRKGAAPSSTRLGSYDNTLVIGSLSKGFSCAGGFIGCTQEFKRLLKMRSNTYIFGGPVVAALSGSGLRGLRHPGVRRVRHAPRPARPQSRAAVRGLKALGLVVSGGETPIVSVLAGDEEDTLNGGQFLFEKGYYVQSVTFPAVPYHAGVLRIQVNANHLTESILGLLDAMKALKETIKLPTTEASAPRQAA